MSNVSTKNPFDLLFIEEVSEVSPPVVIQLNKTQQQKPKQTIKTKPLEPSVVPERDVKDTRGSSTRAASTKPSIRGKRENDRHQKTGRTDGEKKNVAGKGTWGAAGSEVVDAQTQEIEETATPEEPQEPTEEEIQAQLEREIEAKQMSFADYMAQKKRVALPTPIKEARVANLGADQAQWKNVTTFEKVSADFIMLGKEAQTPVQPTVQKQKTSKTVIEIQTPRFQPASSDRGQSSRGRGGDSMRGQSTRTVRQGDRPERAERKEDDTPRGERSARGENSRGRGDKSVRGGDRAARGGANIVIRNSKPAVDAKTLNVNDTTAFPSL